VYCAGSKQKGEGSVSMIIPTPKEEKKQKVMMSKDINRSYLGAYQMDFQTRELSMERCR
jgi:hypothetical protein